MSHRILCGNDCDSNESHTVRILLTPLFFTRVKIFKILHLFKIALRLRKNENYPRKLLEVVIFVHFGGFRNLYGVGGNNSYKTRRLERLMPTLARELKFGMSLVE